VLLDLDLDTTKPAGKLVAHVMSAVAEFERQRIAERTKEALAAVRARGVKLGRPTVMPPEVVSRIAAERRRGATLTAIAEGLNADAVATAHGGRQWWPSTVSAVLRAGQA
jgi:DNA invertase Pin-like site-specific DNA recombinase